MVLYSKWHSIHGFLERFIEFLNVSFEISVHRPRFEYSIVSHQTNVWLLDVSTPLCVSVHSQLSTCGHLGITETLLL